jgi:D-glycero-D-manno-heptose 1,7-bisphosphate phosphatase
MNAPPKLVILGRDGVINEYAGEVIASPDEWVPIRGSLESIARLNHSGIAVAVATNQAGIGRGELSLDDLNRVHAKFSSALARIGGHVEGIFFCPHLPQAGCACHKPAPGLLRSISFRFGISLKGVPVVGDDRADVEAALAAKADPVLVRTGNGKRTLADNTLLRSVPAYGDLAGVVDALLEENRCA